MASRSGGGCAFVLILAFVAMYLTQVMGEYSGIGWTVILLGIATLYAFVFVTDYRERKEKERLQEKARAEARCGHGVLGASRDYRLCPDCSVAEAAKPRIKTREDHFAEWAAKTRLPSYLQEMHPTAFERLVADLFRSRGASVTLTQATRDGGVDVIMHSAGRKIAVQCKRVQGGVGEPVLRELLGAMTADGFDEGIVVTTGTVSSSAKAWLTRSPLPIRIIELDELQSMLRASLGEQTVVPASFQVDRYEAPPHLQPCPKCGKSLRRVKGPYGAFMGCTGYPSCDFKRKIPKRRR